MTEIEKEALALITHCQEADGAKQFSFHYHYKALCRAIEARKAVEAKFAAFKQEVSDAVEDLLKWPSIRQQQIIASALSRFVIAKPDPLVEVLYDFGSKVTAAELRQALAARGLKIVEQDQ